jgi:hypothetical protein
MRSRTERKVPRWMAWRSMIPNQTSTRFSHNPEVGMKWIWILGFGVVVHDQVQLLAGVAAGEVVEVRLAATGLPFSCLHATPQGAAAVRRHRVHKATDCGLPRWLLLARLPCALPGSAAKRDLLVSEGCNIYHPDHSRTRAFDAGRRGSAT